MRARALGVGEGGEFGELLAAPGAHRLGKLVVEIGEEQERRPAAVHASPMNMQRDLRAQQQQRGGRAQLGRFGEQRQPFAHRTIADLIVVLQEGDERGRRQMPARADPRVPWPVSSP